MNQSGPYPDGGKLSFIEFFLSGNFLKKNKTKKRAVPVTRYRACALSDDDVVPLRELSHVGG